MTCLLGILLVAEIKMVKWICGHTRLDDIMNEIIKVEASLVPIDDKLTEIRIKWFGYIKRRNINVLVHRGERLQLLDYERGRGFPKKLHLHKHLQGHAYKEMTTCAWIFLALHTLKVVIVAKLLSSLSTS